MFVCRPFWLKLVLVQVSCPVQEVFCLSFASLQVVVAHSAGQPKGQKGSPNFWLRVSGQKTKSFARGHDENVCTASSDSWHAKCPSWCAHYGDPCILGKRCLMVSSHEPEDHEPGDVKHGWQHVAASRVEHWSG